jgi:tRNA(Ile)-lysidine synthase
LVKKAQKEGRIATKIRTGSEKLQTKPNSPRKTLKNLFQEADIPPWERNAPLLYIDDELIAVAGVGVSYPHLVQSGARLWPEWQEKA